jgi:hypothetical protein
LGHALVEVFKLGPVSPFDAAALVLVVGGVYIAATWTENYGDSADKAPFHVSLVNAGNTIWQGVHTCASLQSAAYCTAPFSGCIQTGLTDLLLIGTDKLLAVLCFWSCIYVHMYSMPVWFFCVAHSSSYAQYPYAQAGFIDCQSCSCLGCHVHSMPV